MVPGEKLPFELNNFAPLTEEQRHILVTEIKKVSVPLMRIVELGKEGHKNREMAFSTAPMKVPISRNKVATFFFTAFHYALFLVGVNLSLPMEQYFHGFPLFWYGHFYMWLTGMARKLWIEQNGDSFAVQTATLIALFVLPYITGFLILEIIRRVKDKRRRRKLRKISATHATKYTECKNEIDKIYSNVKPEALYFIPSRLRSGTCLTQIAMFLESNEAQTLQGAISLCEAYLRNRFGQWHMIHPDNCNLIDYSRDGKNITEYI